MWCTRPVFTLRLLNALFWELNYEIGIDISKNSSKSYDQLSSKFLAELDYVITLCAEEVCPAMISKATRLHWPVKDPAKVPESQKAEAFRIARDEIKQKLENFRAEIRF